MGALDPIQIGGWIGIFIQGDDDRRHGQILHPTPNVDGRRWPHPSGALTDIDGDFGWGFGDGKTSVRGQSCSHPHNNKKPADHTQRRTWPLPLHSPPLSQVDHLLLFVRQVLQNNVPVLLLYMLVVLAGSENLIFRFLLRDSGV